MYAIGVAEQINVAISQYGDRTTSVCVNGVPSQQLELKYGLPQGSIVGPQQFTLYTTPIGDILRQFDLCYHIYADDIQIYTSFNPRDHTSVESALSRMSACIDKIRHWMTVNYLKFNEDKTEFFVAIPNHLRQYLPPVSLRVGTKIIHSVDSVRNLGIVFDSFMSMTPQITSLCTTLNFQLRNISRIRKFLDQDTWNLVIRALVLFENGLW